MASFLFELKMELQPTELSYPPEFIVKNVDKYEEHEDESGSSSSS